MAVMVLVGAASLGALFMVAFLVALSRDGRRPMPHREESFMVLEGHLKPGPRLVPGISTAPLLVRKTLRTPLEPWASSTRNQVADEPRQTRQAR